MVDANKHLTKRSDGFVENSDGQFAVTMLVATRRNPETSYFQYDVGGGKQSMRIEWNTSDKLQIFPQEISRAMLSKGWAAQPNDAAIDWANNLFAERQSAEQAAADKAAADKAAVEKAAADKTAAEKAAAEKAADDKAAADKAAADKAITDKAAADKAIAEIAAAQAADAAKADAAKAAADKAAAEGKKE